MSEIEVLQVPSELELMLALYAFVQPRKVLEVGTWQGGTLREWMAAGWRAKIVAVDLTHPSRDLYPQWSEHSMAKLLPLFGKSQSPDIVNIVRANGPYDWVFIDGDHDYDAVTADVVNYLPMVAPGGYLLLHDIVGPRGMNYGPGSVLNDLAHGGRRQIVRIVDTADRDAPHGIGVAKVIS